MATPARSTGGATVTGPTTGILSTASSVVRLADVWNVAAGWFYRPPSFVPQSALILKVSETHEPADADPERSPDDERDDHVSGNRTLTPLPTNPKETKHMTDTMQPRDGKKARNSIKDFAQMMKGLMELDAHLVSYDDLDVAILDKQKSLDELTTKEAGLAAKIADIDAACAATVAEAEARKDAIEVKIDAASDQAHRR